ncbi:hypothetical protein JKA74_12020 [Marivirga sp. S37H4]|uniref:Uncharacterized protein n=1 Tax=Marivirga aurantiaca TaxID=2802615 RepID=A0A934WZL4_9BACT|nr:hypothetical protein [Marivirga aurantiaca]MBK6265762.1 hypothetical protein [Marivirga aurantiaca]
MKKGLISGILLVAIGTFVVYWSVDHSPYAPLGEQVKDVFDSNSYRMSEFWYYTSLVVGTIIALLGLRNILRK